MRPEITTLTRWIRFNAVGAVGMVVQFSVLGTLTHLTGVGYLFATFLAVESAVLHNFFWHLRWTWSDRPHSSLRVLLTRLVRFHMSNGIVSIAGNLILMRILVGEFELPVMAANLIAICLCALANFLLSHHFVFSSVEHS